MSTLPEPQYIRTFGWMPTPHWHYTLTHPFVHATGRITGHWYCRGPLTIDQGGTIYVADGYQWDGETVVVDLCTPAGLVHDCLYEHCVWCGGPWDRATADAIYRDVYRQCSPWLLRRWGDVRYAGVRVFGGVAHWVMSFESKRK